MAKKESKKQVLKKEETKAVDTPKAIDNKKPELLLINKEADKPLISGPNEALKIANSQSVNDFDYKNKAEALLFSAGKRLSLEFITQSINAKDKNLVKKALIDLKNEYDSRNSSLMITEDADSWKIVVREKYVSIARKVNSEMELSKTIMETLAVIAWKTPILQSEVIRIRTNKAYDHIEELINSGFVTKEKKGRSFILKISQKFYDYFDVEGKEDIRQVFSKIKEAPGQKKVDEFKHEPNSPQKTLGNMKIVDTLPDDSVRKAEEDMDKVRYGKLEVYDENNSDFKQKEDISEIKKSFDEEKDEEVLEKKQKIEEMEEETLKKKTKDLVKQLLEEDKPTGKK